MTNPQSLITRTRKLCEAASPWPWYSDGDIADGGGTYDVIRSAHPGTEVVDNAYIANDADAELIATAPELLMELADALHQAGTAINGTAALLSVAERERDEARAECKRLQDIIDDMESSAGEADFYD